MVRSPADTEAPQPLPVTRLILSNPSFPPAPPQAAKDCEGNHLSFPIPPIELLEHMLQHPEHRPIRQLLAPCLACLSAVHDELAALTNQLLHSPALGRFPALQVQFGTWGEWGAWGKGELRLRVR
jgi:hypothetical protein